MKERLHYTRGYCPIPREQRVFLAYIRLRNSRFSKWILFEDQKWGLGTLLLFFLYASLHQGALCFSPYQNHHGMEVLSQNFLFPLLVFNGFYLSILKDWIQLKASIQNSIAIYEESGLLEGRLWKKPVVTLIQDQLILTYRVKPAIKKILYQGLLSNFLILSFFLPFGLFH